MGNNKNIKDLEIIEVNEKNEDYNQFNFEFTKTENGRKEKKYNTEKSIIILITILVIFVVCLIASIIVFNFYIKEKTGKVTNVIKDVTVTDIGIADAVDKVYDAVVVIEVYNRGQLYSTGTGFVFKTDDNYGYILTNSHVIESGDEVHVMFTNGTNEDVEVIGSDNYSDIAVLLVEKDKVISVASIGSSDSLRVGDTTFAVGAPLSAQKYSWTVTRGILSGKNRTVEVSSNVVEVLQTDAAINPGNSGGALMNANGEVIGINTIKVATDTVEGMGYAIPISDASEIITELMNQKTKTKIPEKERGALGVQGTDVTADAAQMYGMPVGFYIAEVLKGSAAEKAGITKGCIITKIGGTSVSSGEAVQKELQYYRAGEEVDVTIAVQGNNGEYEEKVVTVKLDKKS